MKTISPQKLPKSSGEIVTLEDGRTINMPASKRGTNLKAWYFKPGVSGNPGGRPIGARSSLTADFLKALGQDFNKHGEKVIARARNADPLGYVKVIAQLLPKQIEKTQPLEDLNDEQLHAAIALLRTQLSVGIQGDARRLGVEEIGEGSDETGDAPPANRLQAVS